jgi:endonuclease/exonuclease/phosphatase family metal-dependent hydrolase
MALASLQLFMLPRRRRLFDRLRGGGSRGEPVVTPVSVGCYNVLCSTYAVKWSEREGVGPDGASNWASRWPVIRDIICKAQWDVICLQEVEHTDAADIAKDLGRGYRTKYFKHAKRPPDGLLIAVKEEVFTNITFVDTQYNGVAFGRVDMVHKTTCRSMRVVNCHARGGNLEQLAALNSFADGAHEDSKREVDLTVIAGDFNEDFAPKEDGHVRVPFPETRAGSYRTMRREVGLPRLSRPPHKQQEDQKSGKGKVDWIFVRGLEADLFRDRASRAAILESHASTDATGNWPSDHGAEALSIWLFPMASDS